MADAPKQGALELLMQWASGKFSGINPDGGDGPITSGTFSLGDNEQRVLDMIKKFDPNASWKYVEESQANEGGGVNKAHYDLDFRHDLLPKNALGKTQLNSAGGIMNSQYLGDHGTDENWKKENLIRPDAVWFDENYGYQTVTSNLYQPTGAMDQVFKFAPAIILAIATMGAGAGLAGGIGGAAAASGASAGETALMQSILAITQNQGLNFKSGGSILGALLGAAGVPGGGSLGKIIPYLIQLEQQRRSGGG